MTEQFFNFPIIVVPEINAVESNNKEVLVVLLQAEYGEEEAQLLEKILKAIQIDLHTAHIVQLTSAETTSFDKLQQAFGVRSLICFGVPLQRLGIHFRLPKYQPLKKEALRLIHADSLPVIAKNKNFKSLLWKGLKHLFS